MTRRPDWSIVPNQRRMAIPTAAATSAQNTAWWPRCLRMATSSGGSASHAPAQTRTRVRIQISLVARSCANRESRVRAAGLRFRLHARHSAVKLVPTVSTAAAYRIQPVGTLQARFIAYRPVLRFIVGVYLVKSKK